MAWRRAARRQAARHAAATALNSLSCKAHRRTALCTRWRPAPARAVTLISAVICLVLVASEVYRYVVPVQREHMVVDPVIEGRLRVNFDITFPSLQCSEVGEWRRGARGGRGEVCSRRPVTDARSSSTCLATRPPSRRAARTGEPRRDGRRGRAAERHRPRHLQDAARGGRHEAGRCVCPQVRGSRVASGGRCERVRSYPRSLLCRPPLRPLLPLPPVPAVPRPHVPCARPHALHPPSPSLASRPACTRVATRPSPFVCPPPAGWTPTRRRTRRCPRGIAALATARRSARGSAATHATRCARRTRTVDGTSTQSRRPASSARASTARTRRSRSRARAAALLDT